MNLPASIWLLLALFSAAPLLLRPLVIRLSGQEPCIYRYLAPPTLSPPVPVLLAVFFLGGVRFQLAQPDLSATDFIAYYSDDELSYIFEDVLVEQPDQRDLSTYLRLEAERLHPLDDLLFKPVGGLLLARVSPGGDWRYGDGVRLQGQLETPPEDEAFSYQDYLARQGIYAYMGNAGAVLTGRDQGNPLLSLIFGLKMRALGMVFSLYPDPEASLLTEVTQFSFDNYVPSVLAGILLGVETDIPEQVKKAFQDTGISHMKDVTQLCRCLGL